MSLSELKKYTFVAKYSNYNNEKKRRETWNEAIDRMENMIYEKYAHLNINDKIKEAYLAIRKKEVLGSQRALQFGGKPILNKNERMYNCASSYVDRLRFFQECMFLLLCGCGAGFSVQKHHINKLPNLLSKLEGKIKYTIPDTIEGWADSVGILVNSYFNNSIYSEYQGKIVEFDYSQIRQRGAKLSYTTGKAPGPEPLKNALEKIRKLLDSALKNKQEKIRPIQVYDIIMYSSDAVLSGGVRRSATICLFSHDDEEMINAKTGNWFAENPQRGRSNNSVILLKSSTTKENFTRIMESVKSYGEPGFIWLDNYEGLVNACTEISFFAYWIKDEDKFNKWQEKNKNWNKIECDPKKIGLESGWEFCNLSTINGAKIDTEDKFYEACKNAAIIGTFQAGFTTFPYMGQATEEIVKREALLGVSITGIMENPDILLDPKIQNNGAKIVKKTNEEYAKLLNINLSARLTALKPEGTASCLLGTSSGIHPHHSKRYFRRVQSNTVENLYQYFKKINPLACERSVWSANDTDDIITFCIEVPDGSKTKNQLSAIQLLEYVKLTQQNWVKSGTTNRSTMPWLSHNVSNTVSISPSEWEEVTDFIYNNRQYFCGISLLPNTGDKDYPQAPFTKIYTPNDMVKHYGDCSLFVSGLIERGISLYEDNLWKACDVLLGLGEKPRGEAKLTWINKCKSFSNKYLQGDIKKLTHLMKDVYNWKLWLDLNREYKNVNYEEFFEEEDKVEINHGAESACAGGACSLIKF